MLTIPLTDLTPYEPEAVEVTRHTGDCAERGGGYGVDSEDGGQVSVYIYRSTDGNLYAAEIVDMEVGQGGRVDVWNVDCFFTFPEHNTLSYNDAGGYAVSMDTFSDLFGHDGLVLHYSGELDEHTSVTFHDYYYFDSNRNPVLLARVHGAEPAILDLDGDGANELLSTATGSRRRPAGVPAGRAAVRGESDGPAAGGLAGDDLVGLQLHRHQPPMPHHRRHGPGP